MIAFIPGSSPYTNLCFQNEKVVHALWIDDKELGKRDASLIWSALSNSKLIMFLGVQAEEYHDLFDDAAPTDCSTLTAFSAGNLYDGILATLDLSKSYQADVAFLTFSSSYRLELEMVSVLSNNLASIIESGDWVA